MKNFKSLFFAAMFVTSQIHSESVGIFKVGKCVVNSVASFGYNFVNDSTTQYVSLGSAAAVAGGYVYYQQQSSKACLDGHANGRIMQKANLLHVSYPDFLDMIEAVDSYAAALEFINQYCIDYYFFTSYSKINRFVALADDLQAKNNKRADGNVYAENMILENFKNQLMTAQTNIETEVLNDSISASKRAKNLYSVGMLIDIVSSLLRAFNK